MKRQCCSNNGCNWNGTTANMTGGGGNIDTGYTVSSNNLVVAEDNTLAAAMGFIVIGLVLLVLLLFLCFLLYKRQKTAEQKNEAVQATANRTMYNERFVTNKQYSEFDRLSNKNSLGGQYPISRNSTKISVREAETDFMADKWRSHSMAVPPRIEPPPGPKISKPKRDWQDVGIERRDGGGFERKNDGYDNYGHKKSTESSNFDWRSDDSSDYGPNQIDRSRNTVIRQEQNKIQYFNNQKLKEEDSSDDEKEGGKAKAWFVEL